MLVPEYAPGATPLDPDEAAGLIPGHITTQGDLNTWEEANILEGQAWLMQQVKRQVKGKNREFLEEAFVRELHRRMFSSTWRWAGQFRSSNKNIGVDWSHVATRLRDLLDNTRYQYAHQVFPLDELAVRFHHQLVWIHPFPNGNGRHARLMSDGLMMLWGLPRFTWGQAPLEGSGNIRADYLQALRAADSGEYAGLISFAKS